MTCKIFSDKSSYILVFVHKCVAIFDDTLKFYELGKLNYV